MSARGESRGAKRVTEQRLHLRQKCSEARWEGRLAEPEEEAEVLAERKAARYL
jgi:hypothetical protein